MSFITIYLLMVASLFFPSVHFLTSQVFQDLIVRDSESVAVELTARDRKGHFSGVIFLGSVKYDALKRVYDGRVSLWS